MDIKNAVPIISVYKTIAQLEVVRYKNIIRVTQNSGTEKKNNAHSVFKLNNLKYKRNALKLWLGLKNINRYLNFALLIFDSIK